MINDIHTHEVLVTEVIDGDTIVGTMHTHLLDIQLHLMDIHFRLLDINAPEKRGATKEAGEQSRDYLKSIIEGQTVLVSCEKKDKYGRQLATVFYNGVNMNQHMIEKGYAVPYE